jgi:hypothetical protein
VLLVKNKKHAERTITHLCGETECKNILLKQTTDFKSTKHKNNHLEGTETNT